MPSTAQLSTLASLSSPIAPDLLAELTALFKSLGLREGDEGEATVRYRLYADALRDLPMEELSPVMRAFRIGDLGDGKWAPKPAEIRQAVIARLGRAAAARRQEKIEREIFEDRHRAESRGPISDDERECAESLVASLKAELSQSTLSASGKRHPTRAEAEGWLEAHVGGQGLPPVTSFSDELVAQLLGEKPIGQGTLGCLPLAIKDAAE